MLEFFNELEINTQKLQNNVNEEANRSSINNNDRNKINQTRQNWTQKLNEILTLNKNAINQLINENANREQMRFAVKYNSIYIKNGSIRDNEIRHKCPIGILFIYENDFNFVPNNPNYFKCFANTRGQKHRILSILSSNLLLEHKIFINYSLINNINLEAIECLILYNNKIHSLESGCFNSMPNLKKLDLRSCKIELIRENVFSSLPKLNELDLSANNIKIMDRSLFQGLNNLTKLRLNRLKITQLNPNCFHNLNNLKELEFEETSFDVFPLNELIQLIKLTKLNIYDLKPRPNTSSNPFNGLKQLESFTGNYYYFNLLKQSTKECLKEITLHRSYDDSYMPTVSNGFFNGFPNLRVLNIFKSGIKNFEDNAFDSLNRLEKLSIIDNIINGSNFNQLFKRLSNLKVLCLKQNPIKAIQNGYFNQLSNLSTLDLRNCQLKSIDLNAFQGLINLKKLDLRVNKSIETNYAADRFNFLQNLEYFNNAKIDQKPIVF